MTDMDRKMFKSIISTRLNVAFENLENNPKYIEHIHQQEESKKIV